AIPVTTWPFSDSPPPSAATSASSASPHRTRSYYAFLEQRYAGEIHRRFGAVVESPVDAFNRPVHCGDFGIRIPPSARATKEFFAAWREALPQARKYPVAVRNDVMSKLTYISGIRAAELCAVQIGDVHWENGQ
ncbi:site-specific integrase, partial [Streptomyces spiralis]